MRTGWGPKIATSLVVELAQGEEDSRVCRAIAQPLGHTHDPIGLPVLIQLASHPDSAVRFDATCALPGCRDTDDLNPLVGALLVLMEDEDGDVRNWATFGLGTQLDADGAEVRDALARRVVVDDVHLDARDEAIVGLARRRDPLALRIVASRLREPSIGRLAIEAAQYLADGRLLLALQELTTWWDVDPVLLGDAIAACDPEVQRRRADVQDTFLSELNNTLENRAVTLT